MNTDAEYNSVQTCQMMGEAEEELRYKLEVVHRPDNKGEPFHAVALIIEQQVTIPIPYLGNALVTKHDRLVSIMTLQAAQELVDGLTAYLESLKLPEDCPVDL